LFITLFSVLEDLTGSLRVVLYLCWCLTCSVLHLQSKDKNVFTKLGPYAWIAGAILSAETLLVIKLSHGEFTAPFPDRVKIAWGVFGAVLMIVLVGWQLWIWISSYLRRASPPQENKKSR
jgi:hypothetical protein